VPSRDEKRERWAACGCGSEDGEGREEGVEHGGGVELGPAPTEIGGVASSS
jgi:hypothetical protein